MTIQALISGVAGASAQTAPGSAFRVVAGVWALARDGTQKPSTKAPWAAATSDEKLAAVDPGSARLFARHARLIRSAARWMALRTRW